MADSSCDERRATRDDRERRQRIRQMGPAFGWAGALIPISRSTPTPRSALLLTEAAPGSKPGSGSTVSILRRGSV